MASVRRTLFVLLMSSNAVAAIQFAASIVLARILRPEEIGLFSVAAVLVAMAHVVRDLGSGSYLVREPDLTPEKVRAAFGLMLCTSWVIALALVLASPHAASFYKEPMVGSIMRVLALNMLLIPFGALSLAVLRRNMEGGKQSVANLVSTLVHVAVSITLASLGHGAISLAWASVCGTMGSIAVAWWYRPPGLPWLPSLRGWSQPFRFGSLVTLGAVVEEMLRGANDLIVGRLAGMREVGLLSRATGSVGLFLSVAGPATFYLALPYFSRIHQRGDAIDRALIDALRLYTGVSWPFFAALSGLAGFFVVGLYGPQWEESVALIAPLCAGAIVNSCFSLNGQAFLALGHARLPLVTTAVALGVRAVLVTLTIPYGLYWVGLAMLLESVVMAFLHAVLLRRYLGVDLAELVGALLPNMAIALAVGAIAWAVAAWMPTDTPALVGLAAGMLMCALAWIAGIAAMRHPLWIEALRFLALLRARQNPSA